MTWFRSKSPLLLTALVLSVLLFGSASMTWFHVTVASPVQDVEVTVRGTDASPAVPALALVTAAAALALSIAGQVLRWVVASVIPLSAVGVLIAMVSVITDPVLATETVVGETAGIIGTNADPDMTVMPWLSVVLAGLLLAVGAWMLLCLPQWRSPSTSKYQRRREAAAPDAPVSDGSRDGGDQHRVRDPDAVRRDGIEAWDAFSEGDDPTGR